jgi:hypothetical protein
MPSSVTNCYRSTAVNKNEPKYPAEYVAEERRLFRQRGAEEEIVSEQIRQFDQAAGVTAVPAPDYAATGQRFWVIVYDECDGLPPRVREVEAIPDGNSGAYLCRPVQGDTASWHRLDRDSLYEDQETAELEAAEALLLGELTHR